MRNMKMSALLVMAAMTAGGMAGAARGAYSENFDVAADTTLAGYNNWVKVTDNDVTQAKTLVGFGGSGGFYMPKVAQYKKMLSASETVTAADGPVEFHAKILMPLSDSSYVLPSISLAKNNGVDALTVRFYGGASTNASDNSIQLSSGGVSWGSTTYTSLTVAWQNNTWYDIVISDVQLLTTGFGTNVSGKVTVFQSANPSNVLVDHAVITGVGTSSGSFDKIDTVIVASAGGNKAFVLDDLSLAPVPEPAVAGVMGVAFAAMMWRRR